MRGTVRRKISNRCITSSVARATGFSQFEVKTVLRAMASFTRAALQAGGRVNVYGFGTFYLRFRKGRSFQNCFPLKETVKRTVIQPDVFVVKFRPSEPLRSIEAATVSSKVPRKTAPWNFKHNPDHQPKTVDPRSLGPQEQNDHEDPPTSH